MDKNYEVIITTIAEKQMRKLPRPILEHLYYWAESVERLGMNGVRKLSGYHDEPLRGKRKGQRSIRLNKAYRLFYEEEISGEIVIVAVLEVNKHEY